MLELGLLVMIIAIVMTAGLLPMRALRMALGDLLAADAATLAPAADVNKVILFVNEVNPNEDLVAGDLTEASFAGYAAKLGTVGTQQAGTNPVTGEQTVTILAPAGGWRYEASDAVDPPQVVHGFALVDNAKAVLLGIQMLPAPVTIRSASDYIDLGSIEIDFVTQPMS